MLTGKSAQFVLGFLPFLYRGCPVGNAHWFTDTYCSCVDSHDFFYDPQIKLWVLGDHYQLKPWADSSAYSMSGMMSTSSLWGDAIKAGLIIGFLILVITYCGFQILTSATQQAHDNIQHKQEKALE